MSILILMFNLTLSVFISLAIIGLIFFVRKKAVIDREKLRPFECGFSTFHERRNPVSLRFFLVTLIFLVFDIELIILFPFIFKLFFFSRLPAIILFSIFLVLLSFGLFIEWNQIILEWSYYLKLKACNCYLQDEIYF